jgi:hypothetical protein
MKFKELLKILLCIVFIYFAYEYIVMYEYKLIISNSRELNEHQLVLGFSKRVLAKILLIAACGIALSFYKEFFSKVEIREVGSYQHTFDNFVLDLKIYLSLYTAKLIYIVGFVDILIWPLFKIVLFFNVSQLFDVLVELFSFTKHPIGNDNSMLVIYFSILELILTALIIVAVVFFKKFRKYF